MTRHWALLWKKEMGEVAHTSSACLVCGVLMALQGLAAWLQTTRLASGEASGTFWGAPEPLFWLTMLLGAPLLTMHLFAEERRTGELEMRLASPATEGEVVAAKYAAALGLWAVAWLPVLAYPWLLRTLGAGWPPGEEPGGAWVFYLGVQTVGASFLAVGLVASLLTRRAAVSAMLAMGVLGGVLSVGLRAAPSGDGLAALVSPVAHMRDFAAGVVDSRALFWHIGTAWALLFWAARHLEARRGH